MVDRNPLIEIQNKIIELGKRINAPQDLLYMPTKTDHFATPHVELKKDTYHLIAIEKGHETFHKQTKDINILLYWFLGDYVTSQMATKYELNHRISNQDFRRIYFSRHIELLEILNPLWAQWKKKELDEVLERYPFEDP